MLVSPANARAAAQVWVDVSTHTVKCMSSTCMHQSIVCPSQDRQL